MDHFLNTDITKIYSVSNQTVVNWKNKAKELNIEIVEIEGRKFIADTPSNKVVLDNLAFGRRVKDTSRRYKVVTPNEAFYKSFKDIEILSFTKDLEVNLQSNIKYSYKDGGAKFWDDFYYKTHDIANGTEELIQNFLAFSHSYLNPDIKLNLIDIGYGNGLPSFSTITKLPIQKFIGVDISDEMVNIAKANLSKTFPKLDSDFIYADIEKTDISETVYSKRLKNSVSIFYHIGNTLCNHDDRISVYKNIKRSMAQNDLALISFSIENNIGQGALDYANNPEANTQDTYPLRLLGVDVDECEIILRYNEKLNAKQKTIILDKNYQIEYKAFNENFTLKLQKNSEIDVWRHYLLNLNKFISEVESVCFKIKSIQLDSTGNNALAVLGV